MDLSSFVIGLKAQFKILTEQVLIRRNERFTRKNTVNNQINDFTNVRYLQFLSRRFTLVETDYDIDFNSSLQFLQKKCSTFTSTFLLSRLQTDS